VTILIITFSLLYKEYFPGPAKIASFKVNPDSVNISFYWKTNGENIKNIGKLRKVLEKQNSKLIFATNGGMFDEQLSPVGLFIENGQIIKPLNKKVIKLNKKGALPNFYLEPNGVFYITNDENALAERMNRTIKEEFGLGEILKTKEHGKQLIKEAVYVYNNYKPHLSLNYNTPNEMHKKIPYNFLDYQGLNQYL